MKICFEVQARRRRGVPVRDEVKLARTDTVEDAVSTARLFTADGFTVWIYRVETGDSGARHYQAVCTLQPHEPTS